MLIHDLFEKYGTDKIPYADFYHLLFHARRFDIKSVLEVGIGTLDASKESNMDFWLTTRPDYKTGASLRVWQEFFPQAAVTGMDIDPAAMLQDTRINTVTADSTDTAAVTTTLCAQTFDVIIDDGLHTVPAQLATFQNLYPRLNVGGVYILEDANDIANYKLDTDLFLPYPRGVWYSQNGARLIFMWRG